ncbi:uncharacterized protein [Watersipora subatra]|uniref:uncharacterized protein isoform X2 n=1 Tax=Watersipora subatra TaxID=2589382 RepID=UPI00355C3BED
MFRKFTETLTGTLDTVKSYGSSMGIGQMGQDGVDGKATASKLTLNLPTLGNGSASAPVTTNNSPERGGGKPSLASNTLMGIQSTLGKLTGRGESTNAAVVASHQQSRSGRGPALGSAMATSETKITGRHELGDELRGMGLEDISNYNQYKMMKQAGQLAADDDEYVAQPTSERMNGTAPKLTRSNTDEIINQQFKTLQGNLDDVLGQTEELGELEPVLSGKEEKKEEDEKPKKKKNKALMKCIRCIQDNRVKGGCVDPEEMLEAAGEHAVLKKVLNIAFLSIGSLLFASVVVVIIYTSVVVTEEEGTTTAPPATTPSANRTYFVYEYVPPDEEPASYNISDYLQLMKLLGSKTIP